MDICIIGGGLTGLVAALSLSETSEVTVLEKKPILGGCMASYQRDRYWIEQYYHHCFAGDRHLFSLLDDLGLGDRLEWLKGSTGYYVDGTVHPLTSPIEILRYPHLSFIDKARLGVLTLRAKGLDLGSLDDVPAGEYIRDHLGDRVYASFFEPLLRSKFGDRRDEVSAAWLISRIAIRSDRGVEGERLGYLNGGWHLLIDGLEERLLSKGCTIEKGTPAVSLEHTGGKWLVNDRAYDAVLATIPPQEIGRISGDKTFAALPYQGAACMTIGLDRDVTDGIYWLNMKDTAPYGAVVTHTNFAPRDRYSEEVVYLASYFAGKPAQGLKERMLVDFCRRFSVPEGAIHWSELAVESFAGPVYTTGFARIIPAYEERGLYLAGMFSRPNYPERSMEGSIIAGLEVAERIRGGPHD
ncbi:NAD(P)/FAD-dependent oxidoreductase [Methanofollis formosanus]|uniref:NAD(P)/FAD-dependent oxidoreductase n=1 Tax=Methanofollis formosanus TaxID=299308 RepID=A0A8G1EH78_9EURY|nr:NAD(P)/FAD-dependent oxidoreductase [Methanofollis formosanus]QYZ79949.1 NAD(P)/FAD-dependent oxidoreductase [Methanofollis formosanus]